MRLPPGARIVHLTPARPFFCREVELNPVIFRKGLNFGVRARDLLHHCRGGSRYVLDLPILGTLRTYHALISHTRLLPAAHQYSKANCRPPCHLLRYFFAENLANLLILLSRAMRQL